MATGASRKRRIFPAGSELPHPPAANPNTRGPADKFRSFRICARHQIAPVTETFAMKDVNAALGHLRAGKARHRIVLKH